MSLSKKLEVDPVLPLMRTVMSMVKTIEFEYYDDVESLTLSLVPYVLIYSITSQQPCLSHSKICTCL